MIKTSKHTIKFANKAKQSNLKAFLKEYRRVATLVLNTLWDNPYPWKSKTLNIANQQYDCPTFISTVNLNITTTLSARALKCCSTQVCGLIKAATEKPRRRQYMLQKLTKENKPTKNLLKAIAKQRIIKPNTANIKAELNSICCDYQIATNSFDGFLQLKSIGKTYGKIRIPLNNHRHSLKLKSQGKLLTSFLISGKSVDFRWESPNRPAKAQGLILGADQGYKDILTLSNSTTTPKYDNHNHTLESITKKLSRKRKGSRAFGRAQVQRKNFINWSINQLNFTNVKEIKLEEIININYRRKRPV